MLTPHNCVGRKPHLFYRRRPIWRVGLSYYTHDFGRDDDLPRHHATLERAKAYVTAINETRLYPEPAACGADLLCIYDMREPDGISHEAQCPKARQETE